MNFNVNNLISAINGKLKDTKEGVMVALTEEDLRFSLGDVSYFISHAKMLEVIKINNVPAEPVFNYEPLMIDLLAKHVLNQLFASTGEKMFKDVAAHPTDLLQIISPKNLVVVIDGENKPLKIQPVEYKNGIRFWLKYIVTFDGMTFTIEPDDSLNWVQTEDSSEELSSQNLVNLAEAIKRNFPYRT